MLAQSEHAVESNARMVAGALVNGDAVDDIAFAEILERPEEVLRSNAEHRGANAHAAVERDDLVVSQFLAEAIDKMDFGADGPLGAGRRSLDGFDNAFRRADLIGGLGDLEAAFRVNDDANAGMLAADAPDLLRREALVHGAVALPEDDAGVANCFGRVAAKFLVRIPDDHLFEGNAHAVAGVAAEMFVGEEQNSFADLEGPLHDFGGVGAGADGAAMLAREGFDSGSGVHVCDRDDRARIEERGEFAPAGFYLADVGHVGHGATGIEVGQNDGLMLTAKDVRAFGHEVHAAEDDIAAFGLGGLEGELEGVAPEIGEFYDFVALIVMAKNHCVFAQASFGGGDAVIQSIVRHEEIGIEVAAYPGFDFRRVEGWRLVCADEGARNGY